MRFRAVGADRVRGGAGGRDGLMGGPGRDVVHFDRELDTTKDCEIMRPVLRGRPYSPTS